MLSIPSKPKFFLLNALRGLSMISLLFVFIANVVIMVDDIKALQSKDPDAEECDYLEYVPHLCAVCVARLTA